MARILAICLEMIRMKKAQLYSLNVSLNNESLKFLLVQWLVVVYCKGQRVNILAFVDAVVCVIFVSFKSYGLWYSIWSELEFTDS